MTGPVSPVLKDHLANELQWAIDTTRTPPLFNRTSARGQIEREYARLHACLRDLDHALRGWSPDPRLAVPDVPSRD
jgi:hypothetical protein